MTITNMRQKGVYFLAANSGRGPGMDVQMDTDGMIFGLDEAFSIEQAGLLDLSALRNLEKVCFPVDAWAMLDLIAVLSFPNIIRLKAVLRGEMVGFIAGDVKRGEGVAWIATVGVLPEQRGRGIGTALMNACEAHVPLDTIRLCVRKSNTGAIRLYEGLGYRKINEWIDYYQDGETALVMEKRRALNSC